MASILLPTRADLECQSLGFARLLLQEARSLLALSPLLSWPAAQAWGVSSSLSLWEGTNPKHSRVTLWESLSLNPLVSQHSTLQVLLMLSASAAPAFNPGEPRIGKPSPFFTNFTNLPFLGLLFTAKLARPPLPHLLFASRLMGVLISTAAELAVHKINPVLPRLIFAEFHS